MNRPPKPTYEQSQQDTIDRLIEENEKLKEGLKNILATTNWYGMCESTEGLHEEYGYIKRYDLEKILKEKP